MITLIHNNNNIIINIIIIVVMNFKKRDRLFTITRAIYSIIHTMPYFCLITLKLLSSRVFGGQIHCHVLVLPLIELKSHIRSIDPCETDKYAPDNSNELTLSVI